jgi:hypothetical protein
MTDEEHLAAERRARVLIDRQRPWAGRGTIPGQPTSPRVGAGK